MKKTLIALMLGLGIMRSMSAQAQTAIDNPNIIVTVHPNTSGIYKSLAGVKDTAFGICESVAKIQTAKDLVYKAYKINITNISNISLGSLGFSKKGWLGC